MNLTTTFFKRMVFLLMLCISLPVFATDPPKFVEGDVLTLLGGKQDPTNPDIYVIEVDGFQTLLPNYERYISFKISRPKGADVNYPVWVQPVPVGGSYNKHIDFSMTVDLSKPGSSRVVFEPGELEKTVYLYGFYEDPDFFLDYSTIYFFFDEISRTKMEYSLLQINIKKKGTNFVKNPISDGTDSIRILGSYASLDYLVLSVEHSGHVNITGSQDLNLKEWRVDHLTSTNDSAQATSTAVTLKPREAGSTNDVSTYILKIGPHSLITGLGEDNKETEVRWDYTSLLHMTDASTNSPIQKVILKELNTFSMTHLPLLPTFGPITKDRETYINGAIVKLTIPFTNVKLYKKFYQLSDEDLLKNISVLCGKDTLLPSQLAYHDGNITATFNAPIDVGETPRTVFAEMMVNLGHPSYPKYVHPYGAYTSFVVEKGDLDLKPVTTLTINGKPENNKLFFTGTDWPLTYTLLPEDASFMTARWESSDPAVAEISKEGKITLKTPGKTTIRLISDEAAYLAEKGLPSNDDLLIQSFELTVLGTKPNMFAQVKTHPQGQWINVEFKHNLNPEADINYNFYRGPHRNIGKPYIDEADQWRPVGKTKVTVKHSDPTYGDKTFEVDTINVYDRFSRLKFVVDFNMDSFPLEASKKDEAGNLIPCCTVTAEVKVENRQGEMLTLTADYPVMLTAPRQPTIRHLSSSEGRNRVLVGEETELKYEIRYLNKKNFKIRYTIKTKATGGNVSKEYKFDDPSAPGELDLKPNIEAYGENADITDAILTIKYTPVEANSSSQSCDVDVYISNEKETHNSLWFYAASRDPKWHNISVKNRGFEWGKSYPIEELKDKEFKKAEAEKLKDDPSKLYDYMQDKYPEKIFCLGFWDYLWGPLHVEIKSVDTTITHIEESSDFSQYKNITVNFPFKGGDFDIKFSFPKINASKSYKYSFDDMRNSLYFVKLLSDENIYDRPITFDYTTKKGNIVKREHILKEGFVCLYEPDEIKGMIQVTQESAGSGNRMRMAAIQYASGVCWEGRNRLTTDLSNIYADGYRYKYGTGPRVANYIFRETDRFNSVSLVNEQGVPIKDKVRINAFLMRTFDTDPIQHSEVQVQSSNNNGLYLIPHMINGTYNPQPRLCMEILAEGYEPMFHEAVMGDKSHLVLTEKKEKKGKKHLQAGFYTAEKGYEYHKKDAILSDFTKIDLSYVPLHTVTSYSEDDSPLLDVILLRDDDKDHKLYKLRSSADAALSPIRSYFYSKDIIKNLENSYLCLRYDLKGFLPYKTKANPRIQYITERITDLPVLERIDVDPQALADDLAKDLDIPIEMNKKDVKDINKDNNMGKQGGAFDNFDVTIPSSLPFTIQVTKEGNEIFVKGLVAKNLIPGGEILDALEMLSDFEDLFRECMSTVLQNKGQRDVSGSTKYIPTAFAGIRGYIEGKATYNPDKGTLENFTLTSGGVSVEISGSGAARAKILIAEVGVAAEGKLAIELAIAKPLEKDLENAVNPAKFDIILENSLFLKISAWAQVGFDIKIVKCVVGVEGSGSVGLYQKTHFKPYLKGKEAVKAGCKVELSAFMNLYYRRRILGFSKESNKTIFDYRRTYKYPNDNSNPYYSVTRSDVSLLSSVYRTSTLDLPGIIIKDVDPSAVPLYTHDGSKLFFNNIKSVDDYNDDRIQMYDGATSSDVNSAAQRASYKFDVASSDNTTVLAYEEDTKKQTLEDLSSSDPETVIEKGMSQLKIVAAVGKPGNWETKTLAEGHFANVEPKTAVSKDGNHAAAIWKSGLYEPDSVKVDASEEDNGVYGYSINGDLMFSRFKGSAWRESFSISQIRAGYSFDDYNAVMDGDSVVIVGSIDGDPNTKSANQIVIIFVDGNDKVTVNQTGLLGTKPQIKQMGDEYLISFLTAGKDTLSPTDVYLMSVTKNGEMTNNINGHASVMGGVLSSYKLISRESASKINDFSLLWDQVIGEKEDETAADKITLKTSLYAAELGQSEQGSLYSSMPDIVFTIPEGYWVASFDGVKDANQINVASVVSNKDQGAVVVKNSHSFKDSIHCFNESYSYNTLIPGAEVPFEFLIKNAGTNPIKSVEVKMVGKGTKSTTTDFKEHLLPNELINVIGACVVPDKMNDPVKYTITATFENSAKKEFAGSIDLSLVNLGVKVLAVTDNEELSNVLVKVENKSDYPLTDEHEIVVGLYKDGVGTTVYPGTQEATVHHSKLYQEVSSGQFSNVDAVVAFEVPRVKKKTAIFVRVTVRKKGVSTRSGGEKEEDVYNQNSLNSLTILELFPDPTLIIPEEPVEKDDINSYILTIPDVEGVITNPPPGNRPTKVDEEVTLSVTAAPGYSIDEIVLKVNGVPLEPTKRELGGTFTYMISKRTINTTITIEGVTRITTDLSGPSADGLNISVIPGHVVIEQRTMSADKKEIYIYNVAGALMYRRTMTEGSLTIPLADGPYIIAVGDRFFKIVI